jgi:hypothetical protein
MFRKKRFDLVVKLLLHYLFLSLSSKVAGLIIIKTLIATSEQGQKKDKKGKKRVEMATQKEQTVPKKACLAWTNELDELDEIRASSSSEEES